ncbi:aminoglycoside 3-N-acetyltransferase [Gracilibacillus ureilyticus]|uniref:Aminoglycoside N(3)-acetyltransferase n=1 Tax=Gracilibacillus ureilyticus TaxID=531814 RepID=A0A1H9M8A8_9BACI|nr:AAC(3) family N-acetyltransferase [Gracilibacillus ureilyticus]SER19705.1 aminoglycoside 3-N-acetyltransferase [Gracilibacillus ureilyticus]
MYTKNDIKNGIKSMGIKPTDTLLIHSSMKSLGAVDGGADTVIDALMEYMKDGLLILPTHTWAQMSEQHSIFDPLTERACVGILPNLFMKRPGVLRSLHPTHSVAAIGKGAEEYIAGEENWDTPCPREGCWGKLYDRKAKILFIGVRMDRNTFIHSVEEWMDVPNRLTAKRVGLQVKTPEGNLIDRPVYRHYSAVGSTSDCYLKLEAPFLEKGCIKEGKIGDARCFIGDAVKMADLTMDFLKRDLDLFSDKEAVPVEWYR